MKVITTKHFKDQSEVRGFDNNKLIDKFKYCIKSKRGVTQRQNRYSVYWCDIKFIYEVLKEDTYVII